jgi:hypothetical protein
LASAPAVQKQSISAKNNYLMVYTVLEGRFLSFQFSVTASNTVPSLLPQQKD